MRFQPLNSREILEFPAVGPFLVILILAFAPLIEGGTTYYPVAVIQLLLLVLLIIGIRHSFKTGEAVISGNSFFLFLPFCFAYILIIGLFTPYKLASFQEIQLDLFYFVLFYFSFVLASDQPALRERIIQTFSAMTLIEGIAGIAQYFIFHQRARGTFFNPDFFGEYLAIVSSLLLGRSFDNPARTGRWIGRGLFGLSAAGVILSESRGAALAWAAGISYLLWRKFRLKSVAPVLLLGFFLVLVPNPVQHRIWNDFREDPYSLTRIEIWKEGVQIVKDHPFGIGLGMYPEISAQYLFPVKAGLQRFSKIAESPHNEYLRLSAETGIAGGLLFLLLITFYFRNVKRTDRSFTDYGIEGGLLIFFLHALVDSNFHEPGIVVSAIVLAALLIDHRSTRRVFLSVKGLPPAQAGFSCKVLYYLSLFAISGTLLFFIIKPPLGWYFYSAGYSEIKNHHNQEAELDYQRSLFWEGSDAPYHYALANAYYNNFQNTDNYHWILRAIDQIDQASKLDPINGRYFKLKGIIYQNLAARETSPDTIGELHERAFTNYKQAVKFLPYDASIHFELARLEEASGAYDRAEPYYDRAIELEPNYLIARQKKIEAMLRLGKISEARAAYHDLIKLYREVKDRAVSESDIQWIRFDQEKLDHLLR